MEISKTVITLLLLLLVSSCANDGLEQVQAPAPQRLCDSTMPCFKRLQETYLRNNACHAAREDAKKRYGGITGANAKIFILDPAGKGTLRCY